MLYNKLKKLCAVFAVLAMVIALTACGGGGTENPQSSNEPNETPKPTAESQITADPNNGGSAFDGDDYIMLQQAMIDTTDMAAVAYLGWYEDYYDLYDYSQIQQFILDTSVAEDYPFIAAIDAQHFVPHLGGQLFCIVPSSETSTITVYDHFYEESTYESVFGDVLYYSEDCKPIIIMCNESEIYPNVMVEIVDIYGNMLEYYPFLSGMDGRLDVPYDAPTVWDFTPYDKLGYVTENDYSFDPALLYYAADWTAYVETINDDEVCVGFWFDEYGNMEMCYEVYGGTGYEVYYEGSWYSAEYDGYPDSTLIFELNLVEDNSDIQIARPTIYTAMSFEYDEDYECVYMTYQDYDFLLDVEQYFTYTLYNAAG